MKKFKFAACILSAMLTLGLLTSCSIPGLQGPQGETGPQGPKGDTGKAGSSFLTGKGAPSNSLGSTGDSYLDTSGPYDWALYVKNANGWELLGYLEAESAPLTLSDLNGTYVLDHVYSPYYGTTYQIGDYYAGLTLSSNMIQVSLNNGVGYLSVNLVSQASTAITCTLNGDILTMDCAQPIDITGSTQSTYTLEVIEDGEIYVVMQAYNDYYYVKKVS